MSLPTPTQYWRAAQRWQHHLGQIGTVVASTIIRVAPPELAPQTPYSFLIVQLDSEKIEVMGVDHETFQPGDQVQLVLRKLGQPSDSSVIAYGLKAKKIGGVTHDEN